MSVGPPEDNARNVAARGSAAILPPEFFRGNTLDLAPRLLGKRLVRPLDGTRLEARIVEVEAYRGSDDPAAHSFRGKTARNAVMFGPPGFCYIYLIYGMHHCMNVVTSPEGVGDAVLIRALEPLTGWAVMRRNRGPGIADRRLTDGPAKCCQAFGLDLSHDGIPLDRGDLLLCEGEVRADEEIRQGPRIGITKAVDLPWRFFLHGNPFLSR